jgi:hypothetical protein
MNAKVELELYVKNVVLRNAIYNFLSNTLFNPFYFRSDFT